MSIIYQRFVLLAKLFKAKIAGGDPIFNVFMKDKKVLDVACGEGNLLKMNPKMICGIDINTTLLKKLQSEGLQVKHSDVTKIDFNSGSFDVVHCSNIIEHLNPLDAHKMFQEMSRVLVSGGKILLITPMPKTVWNTFGHIKPYPPQAIKKLFRKVSLESFDSVHGLEIENIFYFGSWGANKLTFLYSSILANLTPLYRGSYFMVIKKNE